MAIKRFQEATTKDWHFALAHYRLARALQKAFRPGAATEAFRASLEINDQFSPGLIGLASTLYDYDSYFPSPPAAARLVAAFRGRDENLPTLFRKNEAARLWQRVVRAPVGSVSFIDRASAYAGLCLRAYDVGGSLESSASTLAELRKTLEGFDAVAAFHAWSDSKAAEDRIDQLRAEGKTPTPAELARRDEVNAKHQQVFAGVTDAQDAIGKALEQLDALGADEAREALAAAKETFAKFATSEPADEMAAKKLTEDTIHQLDVAEKQRQKRLGMQSLLTYFYCKRADKIYSSLADMRTDRDLRAGAARVVYLLGLTLEVRHKVDPQAQNPPWSCMTGYIPPRGPYSHAALRHYDRAVGLAPEDAYIRCQAALTASADGDATRLRALAADSTARLGLADQYVASGRNRYRDAIAEYAAAIERNPNSVDALNGYAYTFWMWHYASLRDAAGDSAPDPEVGERAHEYAVRALQLVEGKRPKMTEIVIRSTLGEVLLARGRFEEAYAVLLRALDDDAVVRGHAVYNEVRWDLAQACLCVARDRARSGRDMSSNQMEARATRLLDEIRTIEDNEEYRPFSTLPDGSDKAAVACPTGRDESQPPKAPKPAPVGGLAVR